MMAIDNEWRAQAARRRISRQQVTLAQLAGRPPRIDALSRSGSGHTQGAARIGRIKGTTCAIRRRLARMQQGLVAADAHDQGCWRTC